VALGEPALRLGVAGCRRQLLANREGAPVALERGGRVAHAALDAADALVGGAERRLDAAIGRLRRERALQNRRRLAVALERARAGGGRDAPPTSRRRRRPRASRRAAPRRRRRGDAGGRTWPCGTPSYRAAPRRAGPRGTA